MHLDVKWHKLHEYSMQQVSSILGQLMDIWCKQILILNTTRWHLNLYTSFSLTLNKFILFTHTEGQSIYTLEYC